MWPTVLVWIPAGMAVFATAGLLISRAWRVQLVLLAVQYAAMFWLIALHWPFGLATVKLVTGWMVCAILGITQAGIKEAEQEESAVWPQGRLFRFVMVALVAATTVVLIPYVEALIPGISRPVVVGVLFSIGIGIVQLGITSNLLRIVLSLLLVMAGFETLYAMVETSLLLTGLLAIVNLGLALSGAYLLTAGSGVTGEKEGSQ